MRRLKLFFTALFVALGITARGMNRIDALSMLESGNNDKAVGKYGEVSRFQILPAMWQYYAPTEDPTDPRHARCVAIGMMRARVQFFERKFKRQPNDMEFYALWNAPEQVFDRHISATVTARARRFANLVSGR